jgi:hypothetical protein
MNKPQIRIYHRPIRLGQLRKQPYWWWISTLNDSRAPRALNTHEYIKILTR